MTAGQNHPPVEKTKENYVAKIVYQDGSAKTVGKDSSKFNSIAGFDAGAAALLADAGPCGCPWRDRRAGHRSGDLLGYAQVPRPER